jgi:hypothetical protein
MKKEQALTIIKQILDEALRKGVITNMEIAQQLLVAFATLGSESSENNP